MGSGASWGDGPGRPTPLDRASADDVLNVAVDHGRVPMAIGALLVLDARDRPSAQVVHRLLVQRAAALPRLGQRLVRTPPGAGRPVWRAVGGAELGRLVDAVTLPPAGEEPAGVVARSMLDATADLVTTRLPLDRPLWRARLLLDGEDGVAGIALTAHHVLADGMGGLAVLGVFADGIPDEAGTNRSGTGMPPAGSAAPAGAARDLPPWGILARDAWTTRLAGLRRARGSAGHLRGGVGELGLRRPRLADRCSLLGRTSDRRRLEVATADLAAVREEGRSHGGTVNDVVVTAVTGALVELLARRGERVDELVVSMPVSRRAQGEAGSLGNATGVVPVRVPAVADRGTRLRALVAEHTRVRDPGRGRSASLLTPAFRALAAVGAFQVFIDHQRLVHTFVTNVRGPAERLRIGGGEVVGVVPVAVNPGNVAVSFDVLSYAGTLVVTLVCDDALVPESAWLAERVRHGLVPAGGPTGGGRVPPA